MAQAREAVRPEVAHGEDKAVPVHWRTGRNLQQLLEEKAQLARE